MVDAPPISLRQADANIYKAAARAAQLQSVKPIIAYWCEYWVLKQILSKSLHSGDADILEYSTRLMDRMEQTKSEYATEEAILDDTAGQAYVEQFAQETLDRAQRVVRANKVTAQTASTFDAAATFFGLVNVWGPPDAETLQKIKYAKWNAARILKAIKENKDPNESNPKLEDLEDGHGAAAEDDVAMDGGAGSDRPRPVTIEDEPEEGQEAKTTTTEPGAGPYSPIVPDLMPARSPPQEWAPPSAPAAPSSPPAPPTFLPSPEPSAPEPYYQPSHPIVPPSVPTPAPAPAARPSLGFPPGYAAAPAPSPTPRHTSYAAPPPAPSSAVDDVAIATAQKHAKWAISALNFEDVPTAVRELRKALEVLGAS